MMYRGYLFNLAEPGLPFSMIHQVSTEFKYFKQQGIDRIRTETLPAWAYHGPSLYLAAKLMWNPDLDTEVLLDDYFTKFYGPAAKPMRHHFDILEQAFAEADYYSGNVYDFPHILTQKVLQSMEATLREAEALTSRDENYAERVHMVRIAFDFGQHFLGMMTSLNDFDFASAKEKLDQVNALSLEAISHKPVILSPLAQGYTDRFWTSQVQQGYDRSVNGNQTVVKLPDEWSAMLDPYGGGDELGLWKPGLKTDHWLPLKTYSQTLSDQGLRYYRGDIWYRTSVNVSKEFAGRSIRLWFGNVDESVRVWINGQELAMITKGRSLGVPWEFDATGAILFDKANTIVVDVTNKVLDELGTGGLVGPAVLWSPAAP